MNQLTQPVSSKEEKPTGPTTGQNPQGARVAALLNAIPTLSALVLGVAMVTPKLPPYQGD